MDENVFRIMDKCRIVRIVRWLEFLNPHPTMMELDGIVKSCVEFFHHTLTYTPRQTYLRSSLVRLTTTGVEFSERVVSNSIIVGCQVSKGYQL
jgi:hypothetical protein